MLGTQFWGVFLNYLLPIAVAIIILSTVVLPEFVPTKWLHHLLHNLTALFIKGILLFKKGVMSTSVPFHLRK